MGEERGGGGRRGPRTVSSQPPHSSRSTSAARRSKSGLVVDGEVEELAREPVAPELDGLVASSRASSRGKSRDVGASRSPASWTPRGRLRPLRGQPPAPRHAARRLLAPEPAAPRLRQRPRRSNRGRGRRRDARSPAGRHRDRRPLRARRRVASAQPHAGEVGHLRFRDDGLACRCGKRGCAEAYGSWGGIIDRFTAAGRPASTPVELLEQAATDDWAAEVVRDALEAIGFAAAALVAAWDPGTLRLGGGVAAAWGETLRDAVRAGLESAFCQTSQPAPLSSRPARRRRPAARPRRARGLEVGGDPGGIVVGGASRRHALLEPRVRVLAVVEPLASFVNRSGWNVSHITASSCVSVAPIDFSARPGCGPCGFPDGWSVTEPTSIPRREEKLPET